MSRFYRGPDKHGNYHRRAGARRSATWNERRLIRKSRRAGLPVQGRDKQGFIPKLVDGRTVMHDPGVIDRWLWLQNYPDTDTVE